MATTKTYNILLDTKALVSNPAFNVNTNDLKTVKLTILINQDNNPVDLTGATVRLAVQKPDKKSVLQDVTVVDAATGSCEIVLDTQAYVIPGKYLAEVMVYYGTDTVAVTGSFNYTATRGILNDDSIESTNEWQSINQAIANAEGILVDLRDNGTGVDAQARADLATVTTSLADIVKLSSFSRQTGETDDTGLLQRAINYAQQNKKLLLNGDSNKSFYISSPIYIGAYVRANFGNATILKTTNTIGVGSNLIGVTPDSYAVDACFILTHANDDDTHHIELENIVFDATAPNPVTYGIYAPRLSRSSINNILCQWGKFDYAVYGFTWWMIHSFSNIRTDGGIATWVIADDGTHTGGSTSINANMIAGTENKHCFRLYGVSYSVINMPLVDYCWEIPFYITLCQGLTINSPSTEFARAGKFAYIEGSNVVMNTPRSIDMAGVTSGEAHLLDIYSGSKVTINSGIFADYKSGTPSLNMPVSTGNESFVVLNNTKLPSNGNNYDPLSVGSIKVIIDKNGVTTQQMNGSTMVVSMVDGKKTGYATSPPADGNWTLADRIINWNPTVGQPKSWVWTSVGWVSEGNL